MKLNYSADDIRDMIRRDVATKGLVVGKIEFARGGASVEIVDAPVNQGNDDKAAPRAPVAPAPRPSAPAAGSTKTG